MRDELENRFTMFKAVAKLMQTNASKYSGIPAIASAVTQLNDLLDQITGTDNLKGHSTDGKTNEKNRMRKNLETESLRIASAAGALGASIKDDKLRALGKITKSSLKELRDTQLFNEAQNIFNVANDHIAELADYGVAVLELNNFKQLFTDYNNALDSKESSFATSSSASKQLPVIFKDVDSLLTEQLDKLMENFRTKDALFYGEYKSARLIKDLGIRHNKDDENPVQPDNPNP